MDDKLDYLMRYFEKCEDMSFKYVHVLVCCNFHICFGCDYITKNILLELKFFYLSIYSEYNFNLDDRYYIEWVHQEDIFLKVAQEFGYNFKLINGNPKTLVRPIGFTEHDELSLIETLVCVSRNNNSYISDKYRLV